MPKVLNTLIDEIGLALLFLGDLCRVAVRLNWSRHLVFDQIWKVTIQSLATTGFAGFFVGAIMAIQFTVQVAQFGAIGYLGGLATSATVREVGPLLIAFMLSGKIGAFTTAELGTMRVTEQIDAIRCLGANPLQELVLPRFIGIVISSFFLLTLGVLMSLLGGLVLAFTFSGVNPEEYLRHIPTLINSASLFTGLFKSFVFAVLLALICTYKGYTTSGGARGVGRSVVSTAVTTMAGLVVFDWLTSLISETTLKLVMGF